MQPLAAPSIRVEKLRLRRPSCAHMIKNTPMHKLLHINLFFTELLWQQISKFVHLVQKYQLV